MWHACTNIPSPPVHSSTLLDPISPHCSTSYMLATVLRHQQKRQWVAWWTTGVSLRCHILWRFGSTVFSDSVRAICHIFLTGSTQPGIPLESLNRVSALIVWGEGRNVPSAGKITLCDPTWHVRNVCWLLKATQGVLQLASPYISHVTIFSTVD